MQKRKIYGILIIVAVFWLSDFFMHFFGVGESNYYYTIKLANSFLFAFIWFMIFDNKTRWTFFRNSAHLRKLTFALVFGTWISFFYLITAYDGLVQFFGIEANYGAPPFVIFGIFLTKYLWWAWHILGFYVGLELSDLIIRKK